MRFGNAPDARARPLPSASPALGSASLRSAIADSRTTRAGRSSATVSASAATAAGSPRPPRLRAAAPALERGDQRLQRLGRRLVAPRGLGVEEVLRLVGRRLPREGGARPRGRALGVDQALHQKRREELLLRLRGEGVPAVLEL